MYLRLALALVLAWNLATAGETPGTPVTPSYCFTGGERIRLIVPSSVGESIDQLVSDDGFICLPIGGTLNIKGKTIVEAHSALQQALEDVAASKRVFGAIAILEFPPRRVYVGGEVRTPQAITIPPGQRMKLAAAITASGGATPEADLSRVRLVRGDCGDKCQVYDLSKLELRDSAELGPLLEPGDVVHIPRGEVFILAGEVATPGSYARKQLQIAAGEEARLSRVIFGAGGLRPGANRADLRLIRTNGFGSQEIVPINLDSALEASKNGKRDADPILKNGDIVLASATGGVSVFGQVARPGVYPTGGQPMKLTRLIALAGGFTKFAKTSAVVVVRGSAPNSPQKVDVNSIAKDGDVSKDLLLEDGDMAFISERML